MFPKSYKQAVAAARSSLSARRTSSSLRPTACTCSKSVLFSTAAEAPSPPFFCRSNTPTTCSFAVTVQDQQLPLIGCPSAISLVRFVVLSFCSFAFVEMLFERMFVCGARLRRAAQVHPIQPPLQTLVQSAHSLALRRSNSIDAAGVAVGSVVRGTPSVSDNCPGATSSYARSIVVDERLFRRE